MGGAIVVWDPRGQYREGALVDHDTARALSTRGAACLPVERELMRVNALAGYFRRAWGAGWPLPAAQPGAVCQMGLYAHHDVNHLHWLARLHPSDEAFGADGVLGRLAGSFKLASDASQMGALVADVDQAERGRVDVAALGDPDEAGGWTVGGRARIRTNIDGYVGLCLHGAARGLRVVWCAVSQTRAEV